MSNRNYTDDPNRQMSHGSVASQKGSSATSPTIKYKTRKKPALPNSAPKMRLKGAPLVKIYHDCQGV